MSFIRNWCDLCRNWWVVARSRWVLSRNRWVLLQNSWVSEKTPKKTTFPTLQTTFYFLLSAKGVKYGHEKVGSCFAFWPDSPPLSGRLSLFPDAESNRGNPLRIVSAWISMPTLAKILASKNSRCSYWLRLHSRWVYDGISEHIGKIRKKANV